MDSKDMRHKDPGHGAESSPAPDSKWWPSAWVEQTCRAQSRWSPMTSSQPVLAALCQTAVHPTENHSTKVTWMDKCLTNTWNCMSNCLFHPHTPNWNPPYKGHTDKCSTNTCNCVSNFIPHPSPLNWNPPYKGHTDKCPTNTCNCVSNVTSH